jgi:exonuclease VII large subunit
VLELDTRVYASAVWRLVSSPVLPLDFRPVVADIAREIDGLQRAVSDHFDLRILRERSSALAAGVDRLQVQALAAASRTQAARVNEQMKQLSRVLIPITYTQRRRFEHDPAWSIPFFPRLQSLRRLADLATRRDEYLMLKTELQREVNRIAYSLREARKAIEG